MTFFNIVIKELKHHLRNKKGLAMMLLLPVALMIILGTALSGAFDSSAAFRDIKVSYLNQGTGPLAEAFKSFQQKGDEMGIQLTAVDNQQQGMETVKSGKAASFVQVTKDGLEIYKSSSDTFRADLVQSVLNTFLQRYQAVSQIIQVKPAAADELLGDNHENNYVKISSLKGNRQPGSMDYYAVTMLTLMMLYAAMNGVYAIRNERTANTASRLLGSPVGRYEVLAGKTVGALVVTLLQALVLIIFSRFVLKSYWGDHLTAVFLLVAAEVVMSVSLGIGLAFVLNGNTVKAVLNVGIPLVAFLGGAYTPIDANDSSLLTLTNLSPLKWINRSIFEVIYSNDFSTVVPAVAFNLALALIFIGIASRAIRREVW